MPADGILLVNKPPLRTSRWTTNRISSLLREKKAGHLGTLDPIATGVLPVVLGRATRLIPFLEGDEKDYHLIIQLGIATDTQDALGKVTAAADWRNITPESIRTAAASFIGEIWQIPPMHSALKKNGQPLYKLARQGIEIERPARKIKIFSLIIESINLPETALRVRCSPGAYMRTLAHDLGQKLGCGAHLKSLVRLASGPFTLEQTVELENLDPETARRALLPPAECLPRFPVVELTASQANRIHDGAAIPAPAEISSLSPGQLLRLLHRHQLIAVGALAPHGEYLLIKPVRVLT